jgi:hypothetical protein
VFVLQASNSSSLHYKCEVAKLGTTATGKFLWGKREGGSVQGCQIKKAWVAQLVLYESNVGSMAHMS